MKFKMLVLSTLVLSVVLSQNNASAQDYRPKLVRQTPENVFIPQDFDNNDNSQVVVDGTFSSTCYKTAPVEYVVNHETKQVTVRNQAYFYSSSWCAFVTVPYFQTVNLGLLPEGKYEVKAEDERGASRPAGFLPVYYSKTIGPDDYLYAPVQEALLLTKKTNSKRAVLLRGALTSSCMTLADVKVLYRPGNVIEILPMAQMSNAGGCRDQMIPFEKAVIIEHEPKGKALIHVRSLSGQAVNNVVNFDL